MRTGLPLLSFVGRFAWVLPALVILGLVSSLAEGIGIGLLIPLIGLFLQDGPPEPEGIVGSLQRIGGDLDPEARLLLISGCMLALILLKTILVGGYYALSAWAIGQISHRLRGALCRQMLGVGYAFIASNDPGRLANTMETESGHTSKALAILASLIINACAVSAFAALLLLISWRLTLVVLGGTLLVSLLMRLVVHHAHHLGHARVEASVAWSERLWESLGAMRLIRVFGQEEREQARFDAASDRLRRAALRTELFTDLTRPVLEALYVPVFLITLLYAWHAEIGLATLFAFLALAYRLQPHIKGLDECRVQLATFAAAMESVSSLLDVRDKPYLRSGPKPFIKLREGVTFDRVSFAYGEGAADNPALRDVSFRIERGSVTAIVGASGAGKSTLINLLCRLYDPIAGEILVDGVPLPELDLAGWRRRLAIAGQDLDLVAGTIRDNIAYGCPECDEAEIAAAASRANAHGFIEALPAGYATTVGDRGIRLSGGQRQRIGLARALLRNPEVLILDEATNAIDSLSEAEIHRVLDQVVGRLTIVIVAHRMTTIRNADHVIVLDQGRVVEHGHPSELFHARGRFADLYQGQQAVGGLNR